MKQIKNIEELKKESVCGADFFILLNHNLKSSKWIIWYEDIKAFIVRNEVDDSEQELTEQQLMSKDYTNIGEAIKKGAFFK